MNFENIFNGINLLKPLEDGGVGLLLFIPLVVLIGEVLFMIALLHMVSQRRSPTSMSAWLLAIFLLPHVSVPLYFLVGTRKRKGAAKTVDLSMCVANHKPDATNPIEGILRHKGIPSASDSNRVELYFDGIEAYESLMSQIDKATTSIDFSTYVFKKDDVTLKILQALTNKAKQGVRVRILIDSLGSYQLYFFQSPLKLLRKAGGEVLFFMPLLRMPFRNYINLRNHRKIYLFDQRRVITGGMNLSNEYMGPEKDDQRWEDLLFLAEGQVAVHYGQIFSADWAYASRTRPEMPTQTIDDMGEAFLQVVPSGPDIPGDALFEALLSAIYAAKERIWIVTPYFVPDESMVTALIIAHHKGVDVKLITPRKSNHLVADLGRSSYMRELEENSVHLALYEGKMLHAKAILFDDIGAMLGSVNLDNRSLFLNYEVVSFAYSREIITHVEAWMQKLLQQSTTKMAAAGRFRRMGENIMRVLAPQL